MANANDSREQTERAMLATTQRWVAQWVVAHNLCPFAARPLADGKVSFRAIASDDADEVFRFILQAMDSLQQAAPTQVETSLVAVAGLLDDFDDYLAFLSLLETALIEAGLEGEMQLASFHPDYRFDGVAAEDVSNYTNRSPYPLFHLIREASLEQAVAQYPDPAWIPQRNITHLRQLGLAKVQQLLADIGHD